MDLNFSYPEVTTFAYRSQQPFPHAVINSVWDEGILAKCKEEVSTFTDWDGGHNTDVSKLKRTCSNIELLPPSVRAVIDEAHSPRFLRWLQDLTGEKSLLPDPYLEGGGIHRIQRGGFLKMHADFNWNKRIHLYRRLNLLLYLNPGWDDAWGGKLELWNQDLKECVTAVAPRMNTMAIFTTDDTSYHGHPHPIDCPEGVTRDSIALYYYSAIKPDQNFARARTETNWRPVGDDSFYDNHATPVQRAARKLKGLFGRGSN